VTLLVSFRYSSVTISVHHEEQRATWSRDISAVPILSGGAIVRGKEDFSHELLLSLDTIAGGTSPLLWAGLVS